MIKLYFIAQEPNEKRKCRRLSESISEFYDRIEEENKKKEIIKKVSEKETTSDEETVKIVSYDDLETNNIEDVEEDIEDDENEIFIQYNSEEEEDTTETFSENCSFKLFKKVYFSNFKKKISNLTVLKSEMSQKINISIVQNNVFCSLSDIINNKTIHVSSSGIYKTKISKRKLKHVIEAYLRKFFSEIQTYSADFNDTIFNVVASPKNRKKIVELVQEILEEQPDFENIVVDFKSKKCFNGCRVPKKVRKKRRLYRIFKR